MSPIARRLAPAPVVESGNVNFGSDGFFSGGLGLPEGDYAVEFNVGMFQAMKADGTLSKTPAFLAVVPTFYPINKDGQLIGEPTEHPLGCGSSAHESFVPSSDGKGFQAVPNGKSQGMWNLSNFGIFYDSLKNAGLPPGLVSNSFGVLDGIWIHVQNVAEPEEKRAASKRAKAKTGAAAMMGGPEEQDRDRTVLIVSEILEGGRPWDGGGGIPVAEDAAPAPVKGARVAPRVVAAAPAPRLGRTTAPAAAPAADDSAIADAALAACSAVLGRTPTPTKVQLKTDTFQEVKKTYGDEMAQLVMDQYLQTDEMLGAVLAELQYAIKGLRVGPLA